MRVGVIADVHGNLPALDEVLSGLRRAGVDRLVCAGDLVGYGPMPNECVEVLAAAGAVCVAGNHDLIALGLLTGERCVPVARRTLEWTASVLSPAAREFLAGLPLRTVVEDRIVVAHGSLDDPELAVRAPQVPEVLSVLEREHPAAPALVLGHTHEPAAWDASGTPVPFQRGPVSLPAPRCVINPGPVGQTRSRFLREPRPLARSVVIDLDARTAEWLATPYPLGPLRSALRQAGLPAGTYRQAAPMRARSHDRSVQRPDDGHPRGPGGNPLDRW